MLHAHQSTSSPVLPDRAPLVPKVLQRPPSVRELERYRLGLEHRNRGEQQVGFIKWAELHQGCPKVPVRASSSPVPFCEK